MIEMLNQLRTKYKFRAHGIHRFSPKIVLNFELGPYQVKTAEHLDELIECFTLRDMVFNKEFRGLENTEYDFDEFDSQCDHIIIVHKDSQKIVGTYRLNSSLYTNRFYTEQEFAIPNLGQMRGPVLELGRACIHREHRRGGVISLLWKGIAEYMNTSKAQTLFGCSSVKVSDSRDAALIYQHLKSTGHLDLSFGAKPQAEYEMQGFAVWAEYFQQNFTEVLTSEADSLVPSLLKSYLKMGAKVIAEPAFDAEFDCIDFLTLLPRDHLSKTAEKKYGVEK
jgi:putative hemolysin